MAKGTLWKRKPHFIFAMIVAIAIMTGIGYYLSHRQSSFGDERAIRQEFARTATTNTGIVSIDIEDEWAVVETQPIDPKTGKFLDAGPGLHIFRKINGRWRRAMDQSTVNAWLEEIPESLLSPEVKEWLR